MHADAAFARTLAYFNMTLDELLADTALLTRVLQYHVVPTRLTLADIPATPTYVTTLLE